MDRTTKPIEGIYANYFEVSYSAHEFMLDFGQFDHSSEQGTILARIVTTPGAIEVFSSMLNKAVEQFSAELPARSNLPARSKKEEE